MKWPMLLALLTVLLGTGLVSYASRLPAYISAEARDHLLSDLGDLDKEERTVEWFVRLPDIETPHKRLSDLGRGLVALGLGLAAGAGLMRTYHRHKWPRSRLAILLIWVALWLIRIPFSFWYYGLRAERGDYPSWADTIVIPIFSEAFSWVVSAVISSVVLLLLMGRVELAGELRFARPQSAWEWLRTVLLFLWLLLNILGLFLGVPDGNEGMVFSCLMAAAVLLVILAAEPCVQEQPGEGDALEEPL